MIDVFRKLRLVANVVTSHEPISYLVLSTLITQYLERYKMGLTLKPTPQATFKNKIAENKRSSVPTISSRTHQTGKTG